MKTRKTTIAILSISLASLMFTSGCTRLRAQQGYVGDEELITAIAPGVDNRESVERTLGRPTFVSQWDDGIWYYVARRTKQLAFLESKPSAQEVMVVRFDTAGNVTTVDRRKGLEQVASFEPTGDKTPVFGRDTSLFEDIFGNIGRVSSVPGAGGPPR
ncbi:outer membrane protein assembly factor BamE [Pacificimonas sp. WHA3]|uniref:Outer membrane protein assembly factor BamE n=1 Tax=Pacificimonas pallii TaxID=2827236 RepID=A0ABS6SCQ3_9SPHN|nr:outer membrane protein assembly factor BamE [Pacificimonas pallii]MBV7256199.1 outer membrane protein assembly factor BamE [Pacificimonas pallii]